MQWNGETYGGFSEKEPWIPMSAAFEKEITVEAQQGDADSVLASYKKLIAMRKKYPVIAKGEIAFLETGTDLVLAYQRMRGEQKVVVLCNLDGNKQMIKVSGAWSRYQVMLENYEGRKAPQAETYTMEPYEIMVLGNLSSQ